MVGVPSLSWWSGPISRIGWPTRMRPRARISARADQEGDEERGQRGGAGAERDVAEDVEGAERPRAGRAGGRASARPLGARAALDDALHAHGARALHEHPGRCRGSISRTTAAPPRGLPRRGRGAGKACRLASARRRSPARARPARRAGRCRAGGQAPVSRWASAALAELAHVAEHGDGRALLRRAARQALAGPPPSTGDWRCRCRRSGAPPRRATRCMRAAPDGR